MDTVVLIGTLDTKGPEYEWVRRQLVDAGHHTILIDVGVLADPEIERDFAAAEVAARAGHDLQALRDRGDRGLAVQAMTDGAVGIVDDLVRAGRLDGVLALAGSGGSALAGAVMQTLPIGVPKLLVSTMASGNTGPYVGGSDVTMMYSVVDIMGINHISAEILDNAAAAIGGMSTAFASRRITPSVEGRPVVAATMFGVTTPAVDFARTRLTELGYEVLVFHATGSGGLSVESLAAGGQLAGVLDLTTTELADWMFDGTLSAGRDRLTAAGRIGIPQVVSVGALDMVNFGPRNTVPPQFAGRKFFQHNSSVTLMRTTAEEMGLLADDIAGRLRGATGSTALFLPLRGVSALDMEDGDFYDPDADETLFSRLTSHLKGSKVDVVPLDLHINDRPFGIAMAERLHSLILKEATRQ